MYRLALVWLHTARMPLALVCGVIAALALACTGSDGGGGGTAPPDEQVFRVRLAGDPGTFDPQLAAAADDITIAKQLFRGLFTYDEDLTVVPAVALAVPTKENGGVSEDGRTYTIDLRQDATWSDGAPVTARDFAFALKRLFDPEVSEERYYFQFYTAIDGAAEAAGGEGSIEDVAVKALDDYTLQIKLDHAQPTLPQLLALWPAAPLREDIIQQYGDTWAEPGKLVGNGPFVLSSYTPQSEIALDASLSYWGSDVPTLQRVVFRIIPEDSAALLAYRNGELDLTSISPIDSAGLTDDPDLLHMPQLETFAVQYNVADEPFNDPLVRQAISRAIDRDTYVAAVQQGAGVPALSWLPPDMLGGDASVGQDLAFNPEAARAALAEAGYPDGEGFPTVTLMIGEDALNRTTAEFLQQQLKDTLNIDMKIEALEENTFYDRYYQGDFQFTWLSWFADYADPENWLPAQFATGAGSNVYQYSNPELDQLLVKAAVELDPEQRLALYQQAHEIVVEDQVVTPVFYPQRDYLVRPNVAGMVTTVLDAQPGDWFATNIQMLEGEGVPASLPDEKE